MTEPLNTSEAFRPASSWWGAMLCPVAKIVKPLPRFDHQPGGHVSDDDLDAAGIRANGF